MSKNNRLEAKVDEYWVFENVSGVMIPKNSYKELNNALKDFKSPIYKDYKEYYLMRIVGKYGDRK